MRETIRTRIWDETPDPDDPFAAARCRAHGYDVYGEVLGNATWAEYLLLLFRGERPTPAEAGLLNDLSVALANAGPRDPGVLAAMNGGVGGSHPAACLIAALGVGAGRSGGAGEVGLAVGLWQRCGAVLPAWEQALGAAGREADGVWSAAGHPPGFAAHGKDCPEPVRTALAHLAGIGAGEALPFLAARRPALEAAARAPLAMTGVAAAALVDLGMDARQAEYLYLILRLPGAAVHAIEQQELGFRHFPFFEHAIRLSDDPGPAPGEDAADG